MASFNVQVDLSTYVRADSAGTNFPTDPSSWYDVSSDEIILFTCSAVPSNLRHNSIESFRLKVYADMASRNILGAYAFTSEFDPENVTWNTKPQRTTGSNGLQGGYSFDGGVSEYWLEKQTYTSITDIAYFLKYGGEIYSSSGGANKVKPVLAAGTSPYLEITYSESAKQTSHVAYKNGPKSGYSNPRDDTTFSWMLLPADSSIVCADDSFTQQSATFYWKTSTDASYQSVAITGDTKTVTIPANTFPTGSSIQWYVEVTDEDGTTTQTDVFSFSTSAAIINAVCNAPVDSIEDGSGSIIFDWTLWSNDGYPASRTEVYWKKDSDPDVSGNWHTLLDVQQTVTSITVLSGTFPAGTINWKVIATNIDGITGGQSSVGTASFICVAAPDAPEGLAATEVPLTTISWQSGDQQAYEISIDGKTVKKSYGVGVYSWKVPEPLTAESHVISVKVQGTYGFWSQPAEITITVPGPSGSDVLVGSFDMDAELIITSETESSEIRWYRDGAMIGTSQPGQLYTDRMVLGTHSYFARTFSDDGNYTQSNTVTGTMTARNNAIAQLDQPSNNFAGWLMMKYCENSDDVQNFTVTQNAVTRHVTGSFYPTADISPFGDLNGSLSCAFRDALSCQTLEAMVGHPVIVKSRHGIVMIGILTSLQKRIKRFYTAYNFSLRQISWEEQANGS